MVIDMNYAIIENGVVVNMAVSDVPLETNWVLASDGVGIGWLYEAGGFSPPPPPSAPDPNIARAGMKLSFAQMMIGLVAEGWISPEEGRAWRDRVGLPAPVAALIATLPENQQFAAETRALAASEILRTDPLTVAIGMSQGKTPEQMDAFFTTYAKV